LFDNIKIKKSFMSKIFIVFGSLIPFISVLFIYLYYRIPESYKPYLIDLGGKWKIHEGYNEAMSNPDYDDSNWGDIILPGKYYEQGFRNKYSIIRKNFYLRKNMYGKDLFFIIGGTLGSMGSVYFNGNKIGEIGLLINNKRIQATDSKYGFFIDKKYIRDKDTAVNPGINNITIIFKHETLGYDGVQDPRIYIGAYNFLKLYYEKYTFINYFFQYGLIYSCLFMLIIILILLFTNWDSEERPMYISTLLLILSVFLYDLFFSGAFLIYILDFSFLVKLLKAAITFICISSLEFIQFYFYRKRNIIIMLNRIICFTVIVFYFLVNNFVIIQVVYKYFIYYFFLIIIYMCFISLKDTIINKTKRYGLIVTVSINTAAATGVVDLLTNLGIIQMPLIFNIGISIYIVMSSVVIIAEFIKISNTNKILTSKLKSLNDALETKVTQRTIKLNELNKKLKKLNLLKNNFITNITHNFRSPLTAIANLSDLALKKAKDKYNRENYEVIYNASLMLNKSINRLLDLAKMDSKKGITLKIFRIDPVLFISNIIDFYSSSLLGSNIEIIRDIHLNNIEDFYSDPDKLEEIINNVISNAIKFVNQDRGLITISLIEKKNKIMFSIKDNGIGIPKNKLKIIFNKFEQGHNIKNSQYRGTGIGLAYAKQLVKYLKGRIWAESEGVGKGAQFFIEFKKGVKIFNERYFTGEDFNASKYDCMNELKKNCFNKLY